MNETTSFIHFFAKFCPTYEFHSSNITSRYTEFTEKVNPWKERGFSLLVFLYNKNVSTKILGIDSFLIFKYYFSLLKNVPTIL